jgi:hypothetical protein
MEKLAFKMQQESKVHLEVRMAFEENNQMACSKVVGQEAATDVKEVAEAC